MDFKVFRTTFNNISATSWRSDLLEEETEKTHRIAASHWQTLSHTVASSISSQSRSWTHNSVALIAKVVVNPTTTRTRQWRKKYNMHLYFCNFYIQTIIYHIIRNRW